MISYLSKSLRVLGLVWPTRLVILAMGEVFCFGFNLAVSSPSDKVAVARHVFIVSIEDKKMGFSSYCLSLSLYIMSSYLMRYSVLHELNTLDAGRGRSMCGVIVVDVESFRST